jgi:hypothetical protein
MRDGQLLNALFRMLSFRMKVTAGSGRGTFPFSFPPIAWLPLARLWQAGASPCGSDALTLARR